MAPSLCEIFLDKFDRLLQLELNLDYILKLHWYVDDFLVILSGPPNVPSPAVAEQVLNRFKACTLSLSFTIELPDNDTLEFLDLALYLNHDDHLCWEDMPRSKKSTP